MLIMKTRFGNMLLLFFISLGAMAQQEATVTVDSVVTGQGITYIHLSSDQPFIAGGNRYVLHMGDRYIGRNIHPDGDLNKLVFMAEEGAYKPGKEMILVYGLYENNLNETFRKEYGVEGLFWNLGMTE
jgi:hypothetical protein